MSSETLCSSRDATRHDLSGVPPADREVPLYADSGAEQRRPPKASDWRSLTPEQVRTFLEAPDVERLGPVFALMATLSLRPSEAAGLPQGALDLETGTVGHVAARDRCGQLNGCAIDYRRGTGRSRPDGRASVDHRPAG